MRGTGCEAVVLHREYPVTKQMAIKMKVRTNKNISVVIFVKSMHILEIKTKNCSSPFFYE